MKDLLKLELFLSVLFLLFFKNNYAQLPTLTYANTFESAHTQGIWCRDNVTDNNGNVYVTGFFHGSTDFDASESGNTILNYQGFPLDPLASESDVFIAKYSSNGELIWVRALLETTFGGINEERPTSITLDINNNIYLTGFTSTRGFFISKWDESGNEIWTKYFDNTTANNVLSFKIITNNSSILVSGFFKGSMDFNPSVTSSNSLTAFNGDGFLLSLSNNGDFEWVKQFICNGGLFITGLDVDSTNNIVLSGTFLGSVDLNPSLSQSIITSISVSGAAISSTFVSKYDSNGNFIWAKHIRGTVATDFMTALVRIDSNDDIVLSGAYNGNITFLPSSNSLNSNGNYSSFISKFSANGNFIWSKSIGNTVGNQSANFPQTLNSSLFVDDCNNIYVSGEFSGNCDFDPSSTENNLSTSNTFSNDVDVFVAMYTAEGSYQWAMSLSGNGSPRFVEFNGYLPISVDVNHNLVISGTYSFETDFDPSLTSEYILNSNSNPNFPENLTAGIFLAKYQNPINCSLVTNEYEISDVRVFPNPSSNGIITISLTNKTNYDYVTLYDVTGKKVYQKQLYSINQDINLSNLEKGVYFVEVLQQGINNKLRLILN